MNWYKKLWSHIGGRPWTYIIRDVWHEAEWLMQLFWFGLGFWAAFCISWQWGLVAWGIYTFGYINGHCHWGTKWIKGQTGNGAGAEGKKAG